MMEKMISEGMKTKDIPETLDNRDLTEAEKPWDKIGESQENILTKGIDEPSARKMLPVSNGEWLEKDFPSVWKPEGDYIPLKNNPENLTWKEILAKYKIDGITFNEEGYPDFSDISVGEVKIDDFSTDRNKNFAQADRDLAKTWTAEGKDGKEWSPKDVREWRKENGYTWHEKEDAKTMQLVPQEVHNNIPHEGGISMKKKQDNELL